MDCEKSGRCYKKITIQGVVQGVGFRPHIYRLAQKNGIMGTVKNNGGSVEIFSSGTEENSNRFLREIENMRVPFSHIEKMEVINSAYFFASNFKIIESGNHLPDDRFISPDLAICQKCIAELEDSTNRRHSHPLNTCVSCGPRFSVVKALPYDRKSTSMSDFTMCGTCEKEYLSPEDRRFHAETISCNDCGPRLLYHTSKKTHTAQNALTQAMEDIKNGGIIAVKGIGGYHFACSPYISDTVIALRDLKGREKKPFAVMFKNVEQIKKTCAINSYEQELLQSNPHPITLLQLKSNPFAHEALFDNSRCGCFLPYTPLHHLMMKQTDSLIMTSANISGSPIIKDDQKIIDLFVRSENKFCGVLYHERKILRGIEDSVAHVTANNGAQIIRRGRGYIPAPFFINHINHRPFLAMGGDLKASFCLVSNSHAYMSQYFGDLEERGVHEVYTASIEDYQSLFHIKPSFVLCDMHPRFFSSLYAENYAKRLGLPVVKAQHHHAHIASVMAEHGIESKVIGVAFDGSGYGDDGNIWGGEFLICEGKDYHRAGQLQYTKILGGDSSAKDAMKTADCFLHENSIADETFDSRINLIYAALEQNINTIQSSSMGRLFDAVSSILGLCHRNSYEGQCAVLLQQRAETAYKNKEEPVSMAFDIKEENNRIIICHHQIIEKLYRQSYLKHNVCCGAFALGFHIAVSEMVCHVCGLLREKEGVSKIALSGGVFQNSFLLKLCLDLLNANGFEAYINRQTSPNDGGISFGQSYIGARLIFDTMKNEE